MISQSDYSIQELSDLSGMPRRTIHFYIQQELLPPPSGAGLGARYNQDHLLRLKLIPVLRSQGLRLDNIRDKFRSTPAHELFELLEQAGARISKILVPKLRGRQFMHYILPRGISIVAPANLNQDDRRRLDELLNAAEGILVRI